MVQMFPSRKDTGKTRAVHSWAVIGIFIILLGAAVAYAREFLMPVTLAVLLFFVFVPIRRWLWRKGISPAITATGITALLIVFLIVMGTMLVTPARQLMNDIPEISQQLEEKFQALKASFKSLQQAAEKIDEIAGAEPEAPATPTVVAQSDGGSVSIGVVTAATSYVPAFFSQLLLTLLLLYFMLASGDLLYLKIVQSFDTMRDKRRAYLALREIEDSIGNYLGAITIINLCLGVAIGTVLYALGMPSASMFGAMAFLLNFIPYIGMLIGTAVIGVVGLVSFDGYFVPLMAALSYIVVNSIEGQIITPYFISRRLRMNTVVVFLSVALWAWFWSVIGMIVAVPLLVVIRVLSEHIPALEKFGNFLGDDRPPAIDPNAEDDDAAEAEEQEQPA
ncbi:MAG: AI-2E family transporter [Proteobacteria bacterium]|nr:AI-2E family transporter [Pseudomonadota bacterium]